MVGLADIKYAISIITHADGLKNKAKVITYLIKNLLKKLGLDISFPEEVVIKFQGLTIHFKPLSSELGPLVEIFIDNIYEKINPFELRDQKIIIDAGANIGCFTLKASRDCKKCIVYSFEPHPDVFR